MTTTNTLYAVLGIEPNASGEDIETAYRERQRQLLGEPDALSLLRVAYDSLRNPAQRTAYDHKLKAQQAMHAATESSSPANPLPELEYTPRRQPRSRARNWIVLLLSMGGTAGFFWLKTPTPTKASAAARLSCFRIPIAAPAPPVGRCLITKDGWWAL